jgi:hypothetical protein
MLFNVDEDLRPNVVAFGNTLATVVYRYAPRVCVVK